MEVLKYIGAAYILWLAIHIAFSKPSTENAEQSASFLKGFMLQFVNVKIYMFGVTALTGYVVGYMSSFPALLFCNNRNDRNLYLDWLGRTDSEVLSTAFPCY